MSSLTNEDLVLGALLALGGDLDPIHIEDIAVRADEIAPGRFRWQKYTQHINLQSIYKALKDARLRGNVRGKPSAGSCGGRSRELRRLTDGFPLSRE